MDHIGEFQKNSTILLELLTMDENSQPITPDFNPIAVIELTGSDGVIQVDNVTLEAMEDGLKYGKEYVIPSDWLTGEYMITYTITVAGVEYSIQEMFSVIEAQEEKPDIDIVIPEIELLSNATGYVPSSDFQIPSTFKVDGNKLTITLSESVKYNRTFRVILDNSISSIDGNQIGVKKMITFTSEYKPLYASLLEVQELLGSLHKYFSNHEIYVAIRNAGQKARQMKGENPDANNNRYREMNANNAVIFQTYRYVAHEAARTLLARLMILILNGFDENDAGDDETGGLSSILAKGITLGDFQLSLDGGNSDKAFGEDSEKAETPLKRYQHY